MIAPARPPGQQNRWALSPPPRSPVPPPSFSESALLEIGADVAGGRDPELPQSTELSSRRLCDELAGGTCPLMESGPRELLGGGRARRIAKSKDRHGRRLFATESHGAARVPHNAVPGPWAPDAAEIGTRSRGNGEETLPPGAPYTNKHPLSLRQRWFSPIDSIRLYSVAPN
jgi:hypothetical protein